MEYKGKKRKQYNPLKELTTTSKQVLKNKIIRYTTHSGLCELISTTTNKSIPVTKSIDYCIRKLRHNWTIHIACFGVVNDRITMESQVITTDTPYFQSEIADLLNEAHIKLKEDVDFEVIQLGWLASPVPIEWDDTHAFNAYELSGMFNEPLESLKSVSTA